MLFPDRLIFAHQLLLLDNPSSNRTTTTKLWKQTVPLLSTRKDKEILNRVDFSFGKISISAGSLSSIFEKFLSSLTRIDGQGYNRRVLFPT